MEPLDQLDHYAILGVSRGASAEEIKRAFRQQMARYHPDRFAGASPAEQAEAVRRAQRINEAYQVLSSLATRAAYDRTLPPVGRAAPRPPAAPSPSRDHLAELYEHARAHLDAGRTLQAAATLREIQAINPFYRDSAALLEQAEAAVRPVAATRRPAPQPANAADTGPDKGRRALIVGGLGGLLLAGAGVAAWVLRRPEAAAGSAAGPGAPAGGAIPTTPPASPTAIPTAPPVQPTASPTALPPPTAVPIASPPPTAAPPTPAPTEPPAAPTTIAEEGALIDADVLDGGTRWPVLAGNGWSVGFAEGAYQIRASQGVGNIWAFNTSPVGPNVQVGVDVEVAGGVGGLLLRYSEGSYLAYVVDPEEGAYRLERWRSGRSTVLAAESHPAVARGSGARNRLLARLEGTRIALRVNGVAVAELDIADPAPTARYGAIARATAAEVVARFTNLALREL